MIDIHWLINSNKYVPFVKNIMRKTFRGKLGYSSYNGAFIVYPSGIGIKRAVSGNNFIEVGSEEDAKEFISRYADYFKPKPVDEMTQKEYDQYRQSPEGRKYRVTVDDGRKSYTIEVTPDR